MKEEERRREARTRPIGDVKRFGRGVGREVYGGGMHEAKGRRNVKGVWGNI